LEIFVLTQTDSALKELAEHGPAPETNPIPELVAEILRLRKGIRNHRDQKNDDRCWLDDYALYALLGEDQPNTALPPTEEFMANCRRFCESRQKPGDTYVTVETLLRDREAQTWEAAARLIESSFRPAGAYRGDIMQRLIDRGMAVQFNDPSESLNKPLSIFFVVVDTLREMTRRYKQIEDLYYQIKGLPTPEPNGTILRAHEVLNRIPS
jgi:hypothetical protein